MKLSILIASVKERNYLLKSLKLSLNRQIKTLCASYSVELVVIQDNKEISIGTKRQRLLEKAKGEWIVFFDDDDLPSERYIYLILSAIQRAEISGADCIGINGTMTTNGMNKQTWSHRLGYIWEGADTPKCKKEGFNYLRPIIHFNPVKREKALQAGFKDMRFGEDKDYSDRLNKLLTKEENITEPLFHYRYKVENHKTKYGIK